MDEQNKENKISAPPPAEIDIRTMESDMKALKESGGELSDSGTKSVFNPQPEKKEAASAPGLKIPGYEGPEKPVFESQKTVSEPNPEPKIKKEPVSFSNNLTLIALIVLGAAIGLGLLGYYIIFPLFFK